MADAAATRNAGEAAPPSAGAPIRARARAHHAAYVVAAVSIAAFLAWSLWRIDRPGLEYDETIFVNAALGAPYPEQAYIERELLGVPTMIMPYLGALKAWLYAPVFALFGVSTETIRVPAVLLGAAAAVLACVLARRLFGLWPAAALAVLLGTDTAFAITSKADWGPTVLSALLRVLALLAYFAFVRSGSPRALWGLAAALGLGVFNKFDFGLFLFALLGAAVLVDGRRIARAIAARPLATVPPLALLAAWLAFVAIELLGPARELAGEEDSWRAHLEPLPEVITKSLSGEALYESMTASPVAHADRLSSGLGLALVALVTAHAFLLVRRRRAAALPSEDGRAAAFLLALFLVMLLGFAVTKQVGGAHHILLVWPLPALLAVALPSVADRALRPPAVAIAAVFGAIAIAGHLVSGAAYTRGFERDEVWTPVWSPEIYAVAERVDAADDRADWVLTADWGVGQIFPLLDEAGRQRFRDTWGAFVFLDAGDRAAVEGVASTFLAGRRTILVHHTEEADPFPGTSERIRTVLAALPSARTTPLYGGRDLAVTLVDAR